MANRYLRTCIGAVLWAGGSLLPLVGMVGPAAAVDAVPLFPKVECASWNNVTHTLFASFGVDNQTPDTISNPFNQFQPITPNLPTDFPPGYTPAIFVVTIPNPDSDVRWFLGQSDYFLLLKKPDYRKVTYDNGLTILPVKPCPRRFF